MLVCLSGSEKYTVNSFPLVYMSRRQRKVRVTKRIFDNYHACLEWAEHWRYGQWLTKQLYKLELIPPNNTYSKPN